MEQLEEKVQARQASDDGAFGTSVIGVAAGPDARDERGSELTARREADDKSAETQVLIHMQGQYR